MRRWAVGAVLLAACGAKSGLDEGRASTTDMSRPDLAAIDLGRGDLGALDPDLGRPTTEPCPTSCGWCRPSGPPVQIAEWGQAPDVAWDGEKLLVVHESRAGNGLVAVDLDGTIRWREELGGVQVPRIAYDREARAGLVVFDSGLRWLGPDGRPVGALERIDLGFQIHGDVAATSSGFLLMIGALSWSMDLPGLHFDRTGRLPGVSVPREIAPVGPQAPPEHATDDDGRATWVAASTYAGEGAIYPAGAGGVPTPSAMLDPSRGRIFGISAGVDDELYLLRADETGARLVLERHRAGGTVTVTPVTDVPRGPNGHLLTMGRDLLVASAAFDEEGRAGLACANVLEPAEVRRTMTLRSERPSRAMRMALTPRGVAVVWVERGGADESLPMLQVLDCCISE